MSNLHEKTDAGMSNLPAEGTPRGLAIIRMARAHAKILEAMDLMKRGGAYDLAAAFELEEARDQLDGAARMLKQRRHAM